MTTDTIVQIVLATCAGLLSVVGTAVGWLVNKLNRRLDRFDKFIGDVREHNVATTAAITYHKERLDHHQRWLEDHERRLSEDRGCAMREERG